MNRKKIIISTLILSLFSINQVYASCTKEELEEFKKIEKEYKVTYEFNKATKDYTVTFNSPKTGIYDYIFRIDENKICKDIDELGIKTECYNISPGEYEIEIIAKTENCNDVLKKTTLKLPQYNNFSDDPLCIGIEEFYLCKSTYDKKIDYETFVSRVNTYKKTKENKDENQIEKHENTKNEEIKKFIENNITKIIIITIFLILLIITMIVTIKSIRKSRRLE